MLKLRASCNETFNVWSFQLIWTNESTLTWSFRELHWYVLFTKLSNLSQIECLSEQDHRRISWGHISCISSNNLSNQIDICENLEILNTRFLTYLEESLGKCASTWQLFHFIWFDIAVRYGNIFFVHLGNKLMNDITYPWNNYDAQIVWSRNVLNVQYAVLITHSEVLNNFFYRCFKM